MKKTLCDKVVRDFSKIKLKKAAVKVPKLKVKANKVNAIKQNNSDRIPLASIINILIKSAVEKSKKERKEKAGDENKTYKLSNDEAPALGGYGTVSKSYGISPTSSYIDYEKLFSYLGKLRVKSAYESFDNGLANNNLRENDSFLLIGLETIEKGTRHVRYFMGAGQELNVNSLVPISGMNSVEWEQFKLWMKLDPVMYRLKTSTS